MSDATVWYRYWDGSAVGDPPWLQELPVVRETEKCVVVDEWRKQRFILKVARKRYAYPTKELALDSYIIRKQRQIQYAAATHDAAKENLELAHRIQRGEDVRQTFVFPFSLDRHSSEFPL